MKTLKMSLANIQGKLSRAEMRKVMAGSGETGSCCVTAIGVDLSGNQWTDRTCGYSSSYAQELARGVGMDGGRGYWCCASC